MWISVRQRGCHSDWEARRLRSEGSQLKPRVMAVQDIFHSQLISKCCPLGLAWGSMEASSLTGTLPSLSPKGL